MPDELPPLPDSVAKLLSDDTAGEDWVQLEDIFDINAMPPDAAKVVLDALARMLQREEITHKWQAIEFLAADYLAMA